VTRRPKAALLAAVALATEVFATSFILFSIRDEQDAVAAASYAAQPAGQSFLSRRRGSLVLDGRRFRYLSYNAFTLTGCGRADEIPSEAEIDSFFGSLRPNSLVRTWLFMNTDIERFDAIVGIASARGQKLIPVLTDDFGACGDPEGSKSDSWYAGGYRDRFMPWLREVVSHYRDEPAIGMWELVNEPGSARWLACSRTRSCKTRDIRGFFDAAGGEIHRLDPHHLVESGAHAPWVYGGARGWRYIHESPGIDVTSVHEYDMRPGASPHLPGAVTQADALGKPLILGEVGIFASLHGDRTKVMNGNRCISFAARVTMFRAKLDATFRTTIDGVNVWNWMPRNKHECRIETYPGDPLVATIRTYVLR
jgi:hypothetical protein